MTATESLDPYLRFVRMSEFAATLERESWVPGVMHCGVCNFTLHRITLYVRSGTVGAGDHAPEPCPNGCAGALAPVTWQTRAREYEEMLEQYAERVRILEGRA
jgi:hypothetical protein